MGYLVEFFAKGGPFMWPLAALGVLHAAAILGRRRLENRLDTRMVLWGLISAMLLVGTAAEIEVLSCFLRVVGGGLPAADQGHLVHWRLTEAVYCAKFSLALVSISLLLTGIVECRWTSVSAGRQGDA